MTEIPYICFTNESTVVSDLDFCNCIAALQRQVHDDFRPYWNTACHLYVGKTPLHPADWQMAILDNADQAGALGYHETTRTGTPLGKVFAKTTIDAGLSWTVTASHELLEMLGDPYIDQAVQVGNQTFYSMEVCDACEDDQFAYQKLGVMVSDFVTPAWFSGAPAPYDFRAKILRPRELLSGGYIGSWDPQSGWTQKIADSGAAESHRIAARAVKHGQTGTVLRVQSED